MLDKCWEVRKWNGFAGVAWLEEKNWFISFSITMYKSLTTFMKGCTKSKPHKWRCDVKLMRHVEGSKEEI